MKNNAFSLKHCVNPLLAGFSLLLVILILSNPAFSYAQPAPEDVIARLNKEIPQLLIAQHVPGVSVTYIQDGKIVFNKE